MNDSRSGRSKNGRILAIGAVAALLGLGATQGFAAERDEAVARAREAIGAFSQRTLTGPGFSFEARDVVFDASGAQHVRFARRYQNLRVIGGDLVVHSGRSGAFVDVSQTLSRAPSVDPRPRVASRDATAIAGAAHAGYLAAAEPELVVYARVEPARLAWDVALGGERPDGTPSRLHVIVDAGAGSVLDAWDEIQTAPAVGSGQSLFDGTVSVNSVTASGGFRLTDSVRGNASTLDMMNRGFGQGKAFTDADNAWGNGSTSNRQTVAVDAHYGGATTWDYFHNVFGRNGIANDGVGANSRVHYKRNYANAFWDDNCFCMTYGDGSGSILPLVSLDVAGHEMSHGVTSRTAGLIYSGESGGLNEGTSDIFGSMVEFYANNPNDPGDYLIGEKLYANGNSFIRSMIKPSADGASADCWYSGVGALDVHYSSGVANHFYYLLAEGTTGGNPSPTCIASNTRVATGTGTLVGIGRDKAQQIWYRALTVYMTSSSNYASARSASIKAADDLYGAGSPESIAVGAAWNAVNRP
ncbi:MAG TPA: M4 family metallopeptidase [Burkholderiaceae bacterium]|nr:M4 family metallopeptidase [Burkholderiaceae bacterium]